ncbi:putative MFS family arabinose efflux permease [Elusimicrobium simillimum]|uniref:MFS transporter n=1 Tax=Elusimicrobium simillimum TaxID=3143438 RepID=UPI003C6EE9C3
MNSNKNTHSNVAIKKAAKMPFFISGFLTAAWAPLVPYAKNRLQLDEASLGLLLLCLGAGSISAMSFTGVFTGKYGCRKVIICAGATGLSMLVLLSFVPYLYAMALILFIFGAAVGILDVAQNIHASQVEKLVKKPLMSGFHSFYSIGSFSGAIGLSLLLAFGLLPFWAAVCIAMCVCAGLLLFAPKLLADKGTGGKKAAFAFPTRMVLLLGTMCFILFLMEGALLDWSAIYLSTISKMDIRFAGMGYGLFAIATTATRFMGDRFMAKHKNLILMGGSVLACCGLLLVVFVPAPAAGLAGFAAIGVGAANIIPVLFSEAGRQKAMPVSMAISVVSMMGYSGILAGPALIGFVSHSISLQGAFLLLALMILPVGFILKLLFNKPQAAQEVVDPEEILQAP